MGRPILAADLVHIGMPQNHSISLPTPVALIARLWVLALTIGCASAPIPLTSATPTAAALQAAPTTSRALFITGADLQSVTAATTLDAVGQLHPEFLRVSLRADHDATGPSVYVDRMYLGDVSWLASIPIAEVRDIAFLHPTEARSRFGPSCPCAGGVVYVQSVIGRAP